MIVGGQAQTSRRRRVRAVWCALIVASLLTAAGAAAESSSRYTGHTSQHLPIRFTLTDTSLADLRFQVDTTCPSRRIWRVTATGFLPIQIVHSRFTASFGSRKPRATATVTGKLTAGKVTGSLTIRRFIAPEHHYCSGRATFTVRR